MLKLYVDIQNKVLLASPRNTALGPVLPAFVQGSGVQVQLCFLTPSGRGDRPYDYVDLSSTPVKLALARGSTLAALNDTWAPSPAPSITVTMLSPATARIQFSSTPLDGSWQLLCNGALTSFFSASASAAEVAAGFANWVVAGYCTSAGSAVKGADYYDVTFGGGMRSTITGVSTGLICERYIHGTLSLNTPGVVSALGNSALISDATLAILIGAPDSVETIAQDRITIRSAIVPAGTPAPIPDATYPTTAEVETMIDGSNQTAATVPVDASQFGFNFTPAENTVQKALLRLDQMIVRGADGTDGTNGANGWTPLFAAVADGTRIVLKVADYTGGTGEKPAAGQYVGEAGLIADLASAIDFRGPTGQNGSNGWTCIESDVHDGARIVRQITDWVGGTGEKPAVGKYVGETGLVDAIADAVDQRGPAGGPAGAVRNNVTAVDCANGNDSTGEANNLSQPFATLHAAISASASGSTIVLSGGSTYTEAPAQNSSLITKDINIVISASASLVVDAGLSVGQLAPAGMHFSITGAGILCVRMHGTSPAVYVNNSADSCVVDVATLQIIESADCVSGGSGAVFSFGRLVSDTAQSSLTIRAKLLELSNLSASPHPLCVLSHDTSTMSYGGGFGCDVTVDVEHTVYTSESSSGAVLGLASLSFTQTAGDSLGRTTTINIRQGDYYDALSVAHSYPFLFAGCGGDNISHNIIAKSVRIDLGAIQIGTLSQTFSGLSLNGFALVKDFGALDTFRVASFAAPGGFLNVTSANIPLSAAGVPTAKQVAPDYLTLTASSSAVGGILSIAAGAASTFAVTVDSDVTLAFTGWGPGSTFNLELVVVGAHKVALPGYVAAGGTALILPAADGEIGELFVKVRNGAPFISGGKISSVA
jgi:hypothetical protein